MKKTWRNIIARFPDRALIVQTGSDARYVSLKTWHQLSLLAVSFVTMAWILFSSIGFLTNLSARLDLELELADTIAANETFIAQLESDQKNAYELRQKYKKEIESNQYLTSRYREIRKTVSTAVASTPPGEIDRFVPWLASQLKSRITAVEDKNESLANLVLDISQSVADISGHTAPKSVDEVTNWLGEVSGDLTIAYQTQSDAMELLYSNMTSVLEAGYGLIEGTPLADSEVAGFNPAFGAGGPERLAKIENQHAFKRFEDRANGLMSLSKDWQQLQNLLSCAPLASPVDYYNLTSRYGNRKDPFTGRPDWHEGVDLGAWPGTKVHATAPGKVIYAGRKGGFGKLIIIDHGCGIHTAYGHLKSIDVKKGQTIEFRDMIGKVGSTGRSTGPHVHYEVRIRGKAVEPYQFIKAGRYVFKEQKFAAGE